jgi:hypothetical protein
MINVKSGKAGKPCESQGKFALKYGKIDDFSEGCGVEIQIAGRKRSPEIVSIGFLLTKKIGIRNEDFDDFAVLLPEKPAYFDRAFWAATIRG